MDFFELSRRERRNTILAVVAMVLVASLLAAPMASAVTTVIAKIKDSGGHKIVSAPTGDFGQPALGVKGPNSLAVKTVGGGGGFFGAGFCGAPSGQDTVTVPAQTDRRQIVTGIIITGQGANVQVTAPSLPSGTTPLLNFSTTPDNANVFVGLGNGLTVYPSNLEFKCTSAAGSGSFVILGQ